MFSLLIITPQLSKIIHIDQGRDFTLQQWIYTLKLANIQIFKYTWMAKDGSWAVSLSRGSGARNQHLSKQLKCLIQ